MSRRTPLASRPAAAARLALAALALALAAAPAAAQSLADRLGRTVQRAAEGELQRRVDQETRRATRCALGDERCIREAREAGEEVEYTDAPGAGASDPRADHPLVSRYAGSEWIEGSDRAFDAYTFVVGRERGEYLTEALEGRVTRRVYRTPSGRSTLEVMRNYRAALEARGFRVRWACDGRDACGRRLNGSNGMNVGVAGDIRYLAGTLATPEGIAHVAIAVNPQRSFLDVVEVAAMDTGMVAVSADALAAGLDADGQVVLDGLYFATASAELLPASDAAIAEAAALLRARPDLRLDVVGHTDDRGGEALNLTLSRRRAQAVADALVQGHGIASERLGVRGAGASQPVADNASEAGRALNRRVELVRR
jgi:outer membrane protein OmpA-like peptidoglycan-associated protein